MNFKVSGIVAATCLLLLAGCSESLPEIVQASGTVKINGEPLPHATVKFIPMADGLDGSHVASALTDEDGKFELALYSGSNGVYACENIVTVTEGPAPAEARSMDDDSVNVWNEFKDSLTNRPIPKEYMAIGLTPLKFDVSVDKSDYSIELER